ncbi:MAG: electron transport complex subunit E [Rhodospirillales bacterium]|nr:electron transport complex subunit E [Rhodospirillales bacterium]
MTDSSTPKVNYGTITRDGLWNNNVVLVQMLALCPSLALTTTAANGLGMGLATTAVMVASGFSISALRKQIPADMRIAAFVLVIAVIVTLVDMTMNAWMHDLHKILGLFLALIVTNCVILGRAEIFASKNPAGASAYDGLMMGLGFTFALVLLGMVREVLGAGTLFSGMSLLLGDAFRIIEMDVPVYDGMLLFALPPGGFIVLGCILAGKRVLDQKLAGRAERRVAPTDAPACHSAPGG